MNRKIRLSFVAPVSIAGEVESLLTEVMEDFQLDFDLNNVPTSEENDDDE